MGKGLQMMLLRMAIDLLLVMVAGSSPRMQMACEHKHRCSEFRERGAAGAAADPQTLDGD